MQNGFELYIEVHRIAAFYIITAILPIYINTCLALLVSDVLWCWHWFGMHACVPACSALLPLAPTHPQPTTRLPAVSSTCSVCTPGQVFSVSPRHLDTRLGIVVTLFLSL